MISACCSFNILVIPGALTWIHWTVRIPCFIAVDSNRKVPDLYFKVVDPKLQVADLKAEVGELRSGKIPPNLTTAQMLFFYSTFLCIFLEKCSLIVFNNDEVDFLA